MSDVQTAPSEPDLSPEAFGVPEEGEHRTPVEQDNDAQPQEQDTEQQVEQQAEPDPYAAPPEFWSAERKALWAKIADPDARKAIHETEKERVSATAKKLEEAATERKSASEKVAQYEQEREQLANWWKDTGPRLATAFRSKWEGVDWNKLSSENPAEWARLRQEFENDTTLIRQASEKHQAETAAANKRAEKAVGEHKKSEHEKLAKQYPDHFGGEKAQKTYDDLRDYLMEQGVPGDRIGGIYESFVVGTALKAMLYDRAQKAAAEAKNRPAPSTTATQTPRRIAPGATKVGGQPNQSEAYRQAHERLRTGKQLSDEDAALLFA